MTCKKENIRLTTAFVLFSLLILYPLDAEALIEEGDTLQFWSVAYIDWQPDTVINQRVVTAVCRKKGINCYVFTDIALVQVPAQQTMNTLVSVFDTSYSVKLPPVFGPIPDEFDNDPRIFILVVEPEGWTGYFDPAHQMPDTMVYRIWQKHSSEREIIFISRTAFSNNSYLSAFAHEFGHMLHWGQDHSPEPPQNPVIYWEDDWIDEAFAMFGMVYLNENLSTANIYDPGAFFAVNPDLPLIHFISGYSYNQVKLWLVYMYEHYGGLEFISALISEQANGILGVKNALVSLGYNELFDDIFEHWVLANYLDNEQYMNGRYGYHHYNFPVCHLTNSHNSYPVGQHADSVASYAADYISFTTASVEPISITFNCDSTSEFRLSFILLNTQNYVPVDIISLSLDTTNTISFNAGGFGSQYNKIIMAVINTDSASDENGSFRYTYWAELSNGISPSSKQEIYSYRLSQNYPNPFNPVTRIKYSLPSPRWTSGQAPSKGGVIAVKLKIYDVLGREIETLVNETQKPGSYEVTWDGSRYASGVYFYKLYTDEYIETKKMVLIK